MQDTPHVPRFKFQPAAHTTWRGLSDIARFRSNTRPVEMLTEPVILRKIRQQPVALITDATATQKALFRHSSLFPKADVQQKLAYVAFGESLSGTTGAQNANQRQIMRQLLHSILGPSLQQVVQEATEDAITGWLQAGRINLSLALPELVLQVAWATLFGPGSYEGRDRDVLETAKRLDQADRGDFRGNAEVLRDLIQRFIDRRRWERLPHTNPFRHITNPDPVSQTGLTRSELLANAAGLAGSGHVTTGLTLAWALWLLGQCGTMQERLHERLKQAPNGTSAASLLALTNETMRLFPPATETMRRADYPLTIAGTRIEPGTLLIFSIYGLHRSPRYWSEPDAFKPERFLEVSSLPPSGAFIPFSGGASGCLGAAIAREELRLILTEILKRITVRVSPGMAASVGLTAGVCLYPNQPLYAEVAAN